MFIVAEYHCSRTNYSYLKGSKGRKIKEIVRILGFPCGSAGEESAWNAEDLGLIPGLGRSPGEGKGYPLQYSDLENSIDCTVQGSDITEWLSLFTRIQKEIF